MKTENISTDETAVVRLTRDELRIINNALNEVCHGVKIPDFSIRIGGTREEVKEILRQIHTLIDKLDDLSPDRKQVKVNVHKRRNEENPARPRRNG